MNWRPLTLIAAGVVGMAVTAAWSAPDAASRASGPEAATAMATAANRLLASLTAEQRVTATFPFDAAERTRWHFIPNELHPRRGLTLGAMSEAQRSLAHDLLRAGLSSAGYLTAAAVIELEGILREVEGPASRFDRNPDLYQVSVFGTPGPAGAWGWRMEGHHLSLHFTIVDGTAVASAPAFLGANPAEVRQGPRSGLRILAEREDAARRFLHSLDPAQRSVAVVAAQAPDDILTAAALDIEPLSPAGIRAADLRADQRSLLLDLIEVYASLMTEELATARLASLHEAGIDEVAFAWAGGGERGDRHYYRIQGPTFLVEYDNVQNDANHIHSVWRDFDGDFGRDILREHLAAVTH